MSRRLVLPLLLASCAGVPGPPPSFAHPQRTLLPATQAALSRLREVQPGIDEDSSPGWRRDDRVLYGVEVDDGGAKRQWLLELKVSQHFAVVSSGEHAGTPVMVGLGPETEITWTLHDGRKFAFRSNGMEGKLIVFGPFGPDDPATKADELLVGRGATVNLPEAFLSQDLCRSCEELVRLQSALGTEKAVNWPTLSEEELRTICGGQAALLAFLLIVKDQKELADILWEVIDKPSLFTMIGALFGGVELSLTGKMERATPLREPLPGTTWKADGYEFPLTISVNDSPALYCSIRATRPKPPLQLGAGIVSIEGSGPSNPERRLRLWLISARRGAPSR